MSLAPRLRGPHRLRRWLLRRKQPPWPKPQRLSPLQRWVLARVAATDSHTLTPRRIYMLPSRAGWVFAVALLVLLVTSINYQLNLGYILTFVLGSAGMASAWVAQRTLQGLQLELLPPEPVFAREAHVLRVRANNPGRTNCCAIQLRWLGNRGQALQPTHDTTLNKVVIDAPAQSTVDVDLPLYFPLRGRWQLPALEIATDFPLGLFRAWSWWQPTQSQWVWPRLDSQAPDLREVAGLSGHDSARPQRAHISPELALPSDIPDDYRAWRSGDALRQVVWRKVAKVGLDRPAQWVTREASGEEALLDLTAIWLEPALCPDLPPEAQLNRLATWALQAEALGVVYAVRGIPDNTGTPHSPSGILGHGPTQTQCVLRHLALA